MEKHGIRDEIVLATKYTMGFRTYTKKGIHSNQGGNNAKSMRVSVEASLKKLKTDYIDVVGSLCLMISSDTIDRLTRNSYTSIGGTIVPQSKS